MTIIESSFLSEKPPSGKFPGRSAYTSILKITVISQLSLYFNHFGIGNSGKESISYQLPYFNCVSATQSEVLEFPIEITLFSHIPRSEQKSLDSQYLLLPFVISPHQREKPR